MCHRYACVFFTFGVANNDGIGSWLEPELLINASGGTQYVASIYWSLSTMSTIAYGDITPVTSVERLFCCFVMVTGTSVYAYGITSVVSIATGANAAERAFTQHKDELNRYMKHMQMPKELQQSLREYFMHYQASMVTFNERRLLQMLSPHLQARITNLVNSTLIRRVPFFKTAEERCISLVVMSLEPHLFVPDELIIHAGDVGHEMYIIKSGEVMVYLELLGCPPKELARLSKGQFFGEVAVTKGDGARRGAHIKATVYSIVYSLHRDRMSRILNDFRSVREQIEQIAKEREQQTRQAKRASATSSGQAERRSSTSSCSSGITGTSPAPITPGGGGVGGGMGSPPSGTGGAHALTAAGVTGAAVESLERTLHEQEAKLAARQATQSDQIESVLGVLKAQGGMLAKLQLQLGGGGLEQHLQAGQDQEQAR